MGQHARGTQPALDGATQRLLRRPPEPARLPGRALALGGTCTGKHGVGLHKMDFLVAETGDGAVDMMRAIKRALDPQNLMNPGKIFCCKTG